MQNDKNLRFEIENFTPLLLKGFKLKRDLWANFSPSHFLNELFFSIFVNSNLSFDYRIDWATENYRHLICPEANLDKSTILYWYDSYLKDQNDWNGILSLTLWRQSLFQNGNKAKKRIYRV